ncbi:MAG: hypothetical protein ABI488_18215, partial [Polyangiaceae bacterium]
MGFFDLRTALGAVSIAFMGCSSSQHLLGENAGGASGASDPGNSAGETSNAGDSGLAGRSNGGSAEGGAANVAGAGDAGAGDAGG